jgi:hypothetical protein
MRVTRNPEAIGAQIPVKRVNLRLINPRKLGQAVNPADQLAGPEPSRIHLKQNGVLPGDILEEVLTDGPVFLRVGDQVPLQAPLPGKTILKTMSSGRIQMILLGLATDLIVGSALRALATLESETTDRSKERRPIPCRGKQEPCLTSAYFGAEAPDCFGGSDSIQGRRT